MPARPHLALPSPGSRRAVVVGAGSFGTAVAVLLARGGFRTTLQTRTTEQCARLEAALRQALGFKDTTIETEHILLALLIERDGRTAIALASLACPPELLRAMVLEERSSATTPDPTDDGDSLLTLAEGSGVAGRALEALGITPAALRAAVERARTGS